MATMVKIGKHYWWDAADMKNAVQEFRTIQIALDRLEYFARRLIGKIL